MVEDVGKCRVQATKTIKLIYMTRKIRNFWMKMIIII